MSQKREKNGEDGGCSNSETNANISIANLDVSDNEDEDIQFVGIVRAGLPTIDLSVSPSTSAAAAAAVDNKSPSGAAATDSFLTAKTVALPVENDATDAIASVPRATLECPICLQTCIHPARLPCGHIFCFLCVKGVANKNRRCAMCRREIPPEFLDHPQLVNGIDDICATSATEDGYQWYYEGRNGGWWAYDARTNDEIEAAFKAYEADKNTNDIVPIAAVAPQVTSAGSARQQHVARNLRADWNRDYDEELFEDLNSDLDEFDDLEDELDDVSSECSDDVEMLSGVTAKKPSCQVQQLICGQLYIIDYIQMTQSLESQRSRTRKIMRRKQSDPAPGVKGVAGLTRWWQYDDRTSQDIEEAYKNGEKSCSILVAGYVYIVDLEHLVQQRQNEPSRCRCVKRDLATIPKKGVAGLRIEGNQVTSDTVFSRPSNPTPNAAAAGGPTGFISTIAARDAAIRIASDIIGSTLAHADELTRGMAASNISDSVNDLSGEHNYSNPQQSSTEVVEHQAGMGIAAERSLASSHSNSIQDLMLSATEDLLDTTQQVIETNQHTIDLFEQALNDFQALSLRNFGDSSDEDDDFANNDIQGGQTEASEPEDGHNGPLGFEY